MTGPVRIGVVGTGSVALRGLLPHLTQDDNDDSVMVTAVCDIDRERAEAAANEFGVPDAYDSYDDLLRSGTVDAVTIATPIGLHYEQGMKAIEHGVDVHFNKTLCTTLQEANDLVEEARERGVKLVASPGRMTRQREQRVRALVNDGAIGEPTWAAIGVASSRYHLDSDIESSVRGGDDPLSNVDPSWYFREPGGGPMYDMTVYPLHSLTGILGPAKRVTAMSGVRMPEREFQGETIETEMDDNTFLLLDFGGSMTAFVYGAAFGNLPGVREFLVNGTDGQIETDELNGEPIEDADGDPSSLPHVTDSHESISEKHIYEDIMQLVDWIREGTPPVASVEHARHVVEIIDKGYRSADSGETMTLETEFEIDEDLLEYA